MADNYVNLPVEGTGGGGGGGAVDSFNGRTGAVVSQPGDYNAGQVTNTPAGTIAAVTVQGAINEIDGDLVSQQTQINNKQPLDSDLTAIAALTTTGFIARTGSGTAAARTLTAGTNISISNPAGIAGDPTIAFSGTLPIASGGTGATTAPAALVNLGVNASYSFSNADYTIPSTAFALAIFVGQTGTLTAARTVTLPAASSVPAGAVVTISDESGTASFTNKILMVPAVGDTLNGSPVAVDIITIPYNTSQLVSDGVNGWSHTIAEVQDGGTGISTAPTNGQLLIGNTAIDGYALSTLTPGAGINITNAAGSITITNTVLSASINIDGGQANSVYGGISPIDGGGA